MSSTILAIGDPLIFEGQPSRIVGVAGGKVEFISELEVERPVLDGDLQPTGATESVPRFRTVANVADLLWSVRCSAWYLWGRVLGKGRGARDRDGRSGAVDLTGQVGVDQRLIASRLRDLGIIPSRPTRRTGQVPAAGEQHGLYCDLFADGVNWGQELHNIQLGEGLSAKARECIAVCKQGFHTKRLNHGYASPNDGDPGFDAVAAEGAN